MNLEIYQKLCMESKILWTQHCLQRMQERNISRADVKNGIVTGEIIEDYPDDYPNPSCLIFGYNISGQILHIVACGDCGGTTKERYLEILEFTHFVEFFSFNKIGENHKEKSLVKKVTVVVALDLGTGNTKNLEYENE